MCVCGIHGMCVTWYGDVKRRENMRGGEEKVNEYI